MEKIIHVWKNSKIFLYFNFPFVSNPDNFHQMIFFFIFTIEFFGLVLFSVIGGVEHNYVNWAFWFLLKQKTDLIYLLILWGEFLERKISDLKIWIYRGIYVVFLPKFFLKNNPLQPSPADQVSVRYGAL